MAYEQQVLQGPGDVVVAAPIPVVEDDDGKLPTEFLLLRGGENDSEKGTIIFDAESAASVMASQTARDVDLMVDLEHLSLDPSSPRYDPDARAWYRVEVRDGDLYAINARWTDDGKRRLREKTQRYISPACFLDKNDRVLKLVNVALTSMPALHGAPALVAARIDSASAKAYSVISNGDNDMDPKVVEGIMKSLGLDPKMMPKVAQALGLEASATVDEVKAALDGFAEKMAQIEALIGKPEPEESEETPAPEGTAPAENPEAAMVASSLMAMSSRGTASEALDEAKVWRESHLQLLSERDKIAKERAALESAERRNLVGSLVKLGVEIPATAWADAAGSVPVERLANEPIDALRKRVKLLSAVRTSKDASPPVAESDVPARFKGKVDAAKYAEIRAAIAARKGA
jgi:phage I-like protein